MSAAAALLAIHRAFAVDAEWDQGSTPVALTVVPFHGAGDDPIGVGHSVRQKGFEVRKADLPTRPTSSDRITVDGAVWAVIDVMDYEEADAWRVMVERAA